MNNDIEKMILQSNSRNKNYKLINKYNQANEDKDFLKVLHQRKKRMLYIGKV